ncbi:hypothetical protein HU200_054610 [Digitaria exilis]|uniref:Uncharacterized protein n=1 Tax=Digitaria exilis TaxID=1010633 RepID=A0A835AM34_9POAL|nr:hypothetical protein HU200_054610 [Digitaria exilis]
MALFHRPFPFQIVVAACQRSFWSAVRLSRPRPSRFHPSLPFLLAHARLPPAILACAALTPRKAPNGRDKPLPPRAHHSLPLFLLLKAPNSSSSLPRRNRSPEFAEPPPSSLTRLAFSAAPPGQTKARTSFPITYRHSSTKPRPVSATAAAGAARRRSSSFRRRPRTFAVTRWCSSTSSPTLSDPDAAGHRSPEQSRAAAAVDNPFLAFPDPETSPKERAVSPSPFFPISPARTRRRLAGVRTPASSRTKLYSGLADGVYELVPAAEEIAQESKVNVVHVDPSPEQEYRFEPEGKPRSIT